MTGPSSLLAFTPRQLPMKAVLVDPHPAWGGIVVAIIATVVFVAFAAWIVVQRIRHGREGGDD